MHHVIAIGILKARYDFRKDRSSRKEKTQAERFIETAREIGVYESGWEFDSTIGKIIPSKKKQTKQSF
jgi:hypothetical protein